MFKKIKLPWLLLTQAQKRVRIVKDALAQIEAGLYNVQKGNICKIYEPQLKKGDQLNKILDKLPKRSCEVCAKGALFLSHVHRFNKLKIDRDGSYEMNSNNDVIDRLKGLFSQEQLDMIEAAFEVDIYGWYIISNDLAEKCISYGAAWDSSKERLKAILNNIIENKGTFKP